LEKNTASGIMLTVLLLSALTFAFNIQPAKAEPRTWIVDDDGPADFHTIQEAINVAGPGDTIYVHNGTYNENVVVDKNNLTLVGENGEATIIDGGGIGTVVQVTANDIDINEFTIRNSGPTYFGVRLQNSCNSTLTDNNIEYNFGSIYLFYSSNNTLSSNNVRDNYDGISLYYAFNNSLFGNSIENNFNYGIHLTYSSDNVVSTNNITSNSWYGIYQGYSSRNKLFGNIVASNGEEGVRLDYSPQNVISGNNLTNNRYGIGSLSSNYNSISGNNITSNFAGILLDSSSNSNFSGNSITANRLDGILLYGSSNNRISRNEITANNRDGLMFSTSSNYNSIYENCMKANNRYGISLYGPSNNHIYHNNFMNNVNAYTSASTNLWDDGYPSGGNYWSDYSLRYPDAQELDDSGIWDTSYSIDEDNQDNYPLMKPWTLALVYIEPKSILGVPIGETFTVSVSVLNVRNLYGGQFNLTFDPTILSVSGVTEGPFLKQVAKTIFLRKIDNTAGFVLAASTFMPPFPPEGAYGNGTLAGVTFKVKSFGQTLLEFVVGTRLLTVIESVLVPIEHVTEGGYFRSMIPCKVDIDPDTLSLRSEGKWITAYVQLPEGYDPADIDASTILLDGTISPVLDPEYGFVTNPSEYLVDHNNDGILERMVKFDRATVESLIYNQGIRYGNVALTLTGKLLDGTPFEGTDSIFVNYAGDVNNDGRIDILDAAAVSAHWYPGPPTGLLGYDSNADFNNDGLVNILDGGIVSSNWGQTVP